MKVWRSWSVDYSSGVHEKDSYPTSLSWVLGCFISNSTQEQCFHVPQAVTRRQEKVMERSQCVQEQQHDARQDTYGGRVRRGFCSPVLQPPQASPLWAGPKLW